MSESQILRMALERLHAVCVAMDHPDQDQWPEEEEYQRAMAAAAAALGVQSAGAPASSAEAEELAKHTVGAYLTACRMADATNLGNYLMKLASVTGVMMANAEGADAAFDRLLGTAQFVLKTMPKKPATLRAVQ